MARTAKAHCKSVSEWENGSTVSFEIRTTDDAADGPQISSSGSFSLSAKDGQAKHLKNADGTQKFHPGMDYDMSELPDLAAVPK